VQFVARLDLADGVAVGRGPGHASEIVNLILHSGYLVDVPRNFDTY
jgi:hypothetical protein